MTLGLIGQLERALLRAASDYRLGYYAKGTAGLFFWRPRTHSYSVHVGKNIDTSAVMMIEFLGLLALPSDEDGGYVTLTEQGRTVLFAYPPKRALMAKKTPPPPPPPKPSKSSPPPRENARELAKVIERIRRGERP